MGNQITAYGKRLEYDIAKKSLEMQGVTVTDDNLSQSYLRFESQLSQNKSSYKFPVLVSQQNAGTVTPATVRQLNQQDAFYCTEMSYFIKVTSRAVADPAFKGLYEFIPFTFPSQSLNEDGTILSTLGYKLWSGELNLVVNGDVILPGMDLQRFLYVPRTQKDSWNGNFPMSTFYTNLDEYDGASDAFYPLAPSVVLLGNDKIDLSVEFPDDLNNAISADAVISMVIMVRGLLAQNVTKVSSNT